MLFAELDKTVKTLSEHDLTENRDPAGWSAKDHLMHVAIWERALLAKLDGRARHQALGLDASTDSSEDWGGLNAQIFAGTRHRALAEVLDALLHTHATTRGHLASLAAGRAPAPTAADVRRLGEDRRPRSPRPRRCPDARLRRCPGG